MPEDWLPKSLTVRMEEWAKQQAGIALASIKASSNRHNDTQERGPRGSSECSSPPLRSSPSSLEVTTSVKQPAAPSQQTECVVCGDKSSGKHYGQFSCEGCKSFFKRSIRRSLSYSCRGSKSCPVDVHHRNQCQFCRLRKCVKMGMRKDGARTAVQQRSRQSAGGPPFFLLPERVLTQSCFPPAIAHLLAAEPLHRFHFQNSRGMTEETGCQMLLSLVEWTRRISLFLQFKLADQELLLRSAWPALLTLQAVLAEIPFDNTDQASQKEEDENIGDEEQRKSRREDLKAFQTCLERLRSLSPDAVEGVALKALLLFSPEVTGVSDVTRVDSVQEKVHTSLEEYCRSKVETSQQSSSSSRLPRLLLRLSSLRLLSPSALSRLFFARILSSGSTMDTLIHDLLAFTPSPFLAPPPSPFAPPASMPFPNAWSTLSSFPSTIFPSLLNPAILSGGPLSL